MFPLHLDFAQSCAFRASYVMLALEENAKSAIDPRFSPKKGALGRLNLRLGSIDQMLLSLQKISKSSRYCESIEIFPPSDFMPRSQNLDLYQESYIRTLNSTPSITA